MPKLKRAVMLLVVLWVLPGCRIRLTSEAAVPEINDALLSQKTPEPETPEPEPPETPEPAEAPEPPEAEGEAVEAQVNMESPEVIEVPPEAEGNTEPEENPGPEEALEEPPGAAELPAEDIIILPEPYETEGETNLSDEGDGAVGAIVDGYTELLSRGLGSLYECEKGYIYFETMTEYLTVNRFSEEHQLITAAGGYNVGEKLGNTALAVDSGWVLRKNPTVLVKCVGSDILGRGVSSAGAADEAAKGILNRVGLEGAGFVINRRVLLISEELLTTDEGRLLAKMYMANAMYPSLFSDVDIGEFCVQIRDSGGADYTAGVYAYGL